MTYEELLEYCGLYNKRNGMCTCFANNIRLTIRQSSSIFSIHQIKGELMTIREISKGHTKTRNEKILRLLLKHSVKYVAGIMNLEPSTIYVISHRHKKYIERS